MIDAVMARLATDLAGWVDGNAEHFSPARPRLINWMGGMVLDCSRRVALDFQRAIMTVDLRHEGAALLPPVTMIHGDQAASAPIDLTARRYAALILDAELLVYEGAAHGLIVMTAPRLAADVVSGCGRERGVHRRVQRPARAARALQGLLTGADKAKVEVMRLYGR